MVSMTNRDLKRFWSKVNRTSHCWIWTASLDGRGYGKFVMWRDGKHTYYIAPRIAWQISNGPVPEGMQVCHKCDNPKCVRIGHLFLGSAVDNAKDMLRKGRFPKRTRELNPNSKLTYKDVQSIRRIKSTGVSAETISKAYKITKKHVWNLCAKNSKLWR